MLFKIIATTSFSYVLLDDTSNLLGGLAKGKGEDSCGWDEMWGSYAELCVQSIIVDLLWTAEQITGN